MDPVPSITRRESKGVTLLADPNRPRGVTLAFTERTGGVSTGAYSSLNLGDACGDDADAVSENRRRALDAIGAGDLSDRLVNPHQVHGDTVVVVHEGTDDELASVRCEAREGADAVVCLAEDVPVLLCYADCVPVIIVAPGGFAVVHSGWRGTDARIAAKAARELLVQTGADASELLAYIGPHIGTADYEVSAELAWHFTDAFGPGCVQGADHLDLEYCVRAALAEAGVGEDQVASCGGSTASSTDRFYSFRAEGTCGRHGALAFRPSDAA